MKRLPRLDAFYWILIVSANTIGESGGDLISMTLGVGYGASTLILAGLLLAVVIVAVAVRTQHLAIYWAAIILSSTAGTTLSDYVTRRLGLGYGYGSLLIVTCLVVTFVVWRLIAPAQTVDTAMSRRTEVLYWTAILFSSTLGTAFGDYIADEKTGLAMGFVGGTVLLASVLVAVALTYRFTRIPPAVCYWMAIVVTHPLGATFGDTLTKDTDEGGVGLGTVKATLILTAVFVVISVAGYLVRGRRKSLEGPPIAETAPDAPPAP